MTIYKEEYYQKYSKQQHQYYLNYVDSGFIHASVNWIHKHRFLEKYEILFVTEGELLIQIDEKNLTISENCLIIIPPFKTLAGNKASAEKTSFYWVDFMTDAPSFFGINSMTIQNIYHSDFRNLFEKLSVSANLMDCPGYIYDSYLIMIFDGLKNIENTNSDGKRLALLINSFIESNISKPLTVQYISDSLNYNKDYLCRIVNQYYGISLKEHITRLKINLSKRLLTTSNYTIKEISDFLGYNDSNLFTKFFKYHTGIPPLEYRKTQG